MCDFLLALQYSKIHYLMSPMDLCNFVSFLKNLRVLIYSKLHKKNPLITYTMLQPVALARVDLSLIHI